MAGTTGRRMRCAQSLRRAAVSLAGTCHLLPEFAILDDLFNPFQADYRPIRPFAHPFKVLGEFQFAKLALTRARSAPPLAPRRPRACRGTPPGCSGKEIFAIGRRGSRRRALGRNSPRD